MLGEMWMNATSNIITCNKYHLVYSKAVEYIELLQEVKEM
jgi:hypothetical protein